MPKDTNELRGRLLVGFGAVARDCAEVHGEERNKILRTRHSAHVNRFNFGVRTFTDNTSGPIDGFLLQKSAVYRFPRAGKATVPNTHGVEPRTNRSRESAILRKEHRHTVLSAYAITPIAGRGTICQKAKQLENRLHLAARWDAIGNGHGSRSKRTGNAQS